MLWQETYAALALDRQYALLDEAATQGLARALAPGTPCYREWLARQLVILALRLAPSLRSSPRGPLSDESLTAMPRAAPAGGRRLAPPAR